MSAIATIGAELRALRYRPGPKALTAIWCAQIVVFAYAISYLVYRYVPDLTAAQRAEVHQGLLPGRMDSQALYAMPVYGGPVMLVIGAVLGGGDYRWGTLRTILARRPHRSGFLVGRMAALAVAMLGMSVLTLALNGICSSILALADHDPAGWPSPGSIAGHLAALWLVCTTWSLVGFALAVLTRSTAAAIGTGLLWTLVVENVVAGLSASVPVLAQVRKGLLSPATGSLAAALGGGVPGRGAPGVAAVVGGPVAALVLFAFAAAAAGLSLWVFARRDVM